MTLSEIFCDCSKSFVIGCIVNTAKMFVTPFYCGVFLFHLTTGKDYVFRIKMQLKRRGTEVRQKELFVDSDY